MTGSGRPTFGRKVDGCPYVIRPSAYGLIRSASGEIAVVYTPAGCFLPGGGIDGGETVEQAVKREVGEECGLVVDVGRIVGHAVQITHSIEENACFEKQCTFVEAVVRGYTMSSEPDHDLRWLPHDRVLSELTLESHRWAVEHALH